MQGGQRSAATFSLKRNCQAIYSDKGKLFMRMGTAKRKHFATTNTQNCIFLSEVLLK
jgi:competence CoiA-like predicted nuclease